jgi:hypothetical protein
MDSATPQSGHSGPCVVTTFSRRGPSGTLLPPTNQAAPVPHRHTGTGGLRWREVRLVSTVPTTALHPGQVNKLAVLLGRAGRGGAVRQASLRPTHG